MLTQGRTLECYVVGYHIDDSRPFVEIFSTDENNKVYLPSFRDQLPPKLVVGLFEAWKKLR